VVSGQWSVVSGLFRPQLFINYRLLIVLSLLTCASQILAAQDAEEDGASFGYKYEGPRFPLRLIEIDLTATGSGEVRFVRGESDDVIKIKLKLLPATLARINQLYANAQFLTSSEDYQSKKDFSHLGSMTVTARRGEQSRQARFNYTTNEAIKELTDIFRGIATQHIHLFDIETAQQYQQLDLPQQLDYLENDLRAERIAEPEQVLSALRDLAANDALPLIARNHAIRIITSIEKKKFKSPMKK
jgi:hypothetical protein